jgi:F-type H+-transporting ATPase subunit b
MRKLVLPATLLAAPAAAHADSGKLPQMDFSNPLTISQVVWMAIIMGVLYALLRTWLLPRLGAILADRLGRIRADLDAAQGARRDAERAVAELDRAIAEARAESDRTVNAAIEHAKALAHAERTAANASLEAELSRAEQQIAESRATAMASLVPIAEDVAASLIERVTGQSADRALLARAVAHAPA